MLRFYRDETASLGTGSIELRCTVERPKWIAIVTGIISLGLGFGYLIMVQFLDFRGNFQPAPEESVPAQTTKP
jgi:hypothetical protein